MSVASRAGGFTYMRAGGRARNKQDHPTSNARASIRVDQTLDSTQVVRGG